MPSALELKGKEAYLRLIEAGVEITLKEFAARSDELLGQSVSVDRVKHWSAEDGWSEAAKAVRLAGGLKHYERAYVLIDRSYKLAMEAAKPRDLSMLSRAYLDALRGLPEELVLQEEEDRLVALEAEVYTELEIGEMNSTTFASLMKTRAMLNKRLIPDISVVELDGVDADALLLGLVDEEELDA